MPSLPRTDVDSTVRGTLTESQTVVQTKNFTSYTREPLLTEIPDQGVVLATVSGTVYVYARLGQKRYRAAMTLV